MKKPTLFLLGVAFLCCIGLVYAVADGVVIVSGGSTTQGTVSSAQLDTLQNCFPAALTNNDTRGPTLSSALNGTTATFTGSVFAGTDVRAGANNNVYFNGRAQFGSPDTGTIQIYNSAGTGLTKFELGPTTAWPTIYTSTNSTGSIASFNGAIAVTNGFASYYSNTVAIAATGWTNTFGVDADVYVTATAVAFTIKDANAATLYTSPTLTATMPVHLHPSWSVNSASGLAGTAIGH